MFKLLFPVLFLRTSFLGGLLGGIGSVVGGLFGMEGQKDANDTNAQLARENREWMSEENRIQRDFNSAEAALNRSFQSDEAKVARDYLSEMSNSQYLRAVRDMRAAGLNPMLLTGKAGGATTPATAAPAGSSATATSVGSPSLSRMENVFSSAANVANSLAVMGRAVAETEQVKAQTDVSKAQAINVAEDTKLKAALGHESFWRALKTQGEETKVYKEIEKLQADIIHSGSSAEKLRSITRLLDLSLPKAVNEAMAEDTWWKRNISPFLKDASSSGNILQHLPIFRMLKK